MGTIDVERLAAIREAVVMHLGGLAAGLAFMALWFGWKRLRRWLVDWRWRRRLAHDPMVSLDERREHQWVLERLDLAEAEEAEQPLGQRLADGLWLVFAIAASSVTALWFGFDWELTFLATLTVGGGLLWLWHHLNGEPDRSEPMAGLRTARPEVELPFEAVAGAAAAVLVVGGILLLFLLV